MKKKKIAILFSGGLDSTYLMWKALENEQDVYPIYINLENNLDKVQIEKQQIELLIKEFNKDYNKDIYIKEFSKLYIKESFNLSFSQPYIWTTLLKTGLTKGVDEIQIGYVFGDSVVSYIPEIKKLYNASKPFTHYHPKLTFPYIKTSKYNIIDQLPDKYKKLVVSCENPKLLPYGIKNNYVKYRFFEPCGNCEVCKKIIHNDYYDCDVTKHNYINAAKIYYGNQTHRVKEKLEEISSYKGMPTKEGVEVKQYKKCKENDILLAK